METTTTAAPTSATSRTPVRTTAPWAWWGVVAGATGLAGNLVASHGPTSGYDAATAVAESDRATQHIGTALGLVAFAALLLLAAGWRHWARERGVVSGSIAPALTVTASLVLFGVGLRGAMAEYLPGGINADNFDDAGLYVLFMLHDTAPWTAWWGVLLAAAAVAWLSFAEGAFSRWLGAFSVVALIPPVAVMAGSGAVAGGGFIGPLWLLVASLVIASRGLREKA
ncbi:MAG TPA: hypothetical protein VFK52_04300 [Nocardioidaceae bacterium]|nr:hypothetical protein [Nocardioidaceae bacterium]